MTAPHPAHPSRRTGWQVFRWPALLAAACSVGLVGALMMEGWTDLIWIAAVALPIIVIGARIRPR